MRFELVRLDLRIALELGHGLRLGRRPHRALLRPVVLVRVRVRVGVWVRVWVWVRVRVRVRVRVS